MLPRDRHTAGRGGVAQVVEVALRQRDLPSDERLGFTLGELFDDPDAWSMAVQAVPDLAGLEVGLHGRGERTLRQIVSRLPNRDASRANLEAVLDRIRGQESGARS